MEKCVLYNGTRITYRIGEFRDARYHPAIKVTRDIIDYINFSITLNFTSRGYREL